MTRPAWQLLVYGPLSRDQAQLCDSQIDWGHTHPDRPDPARLHELCSNALAAGHIDIAVHYAWAAEGVERERSRS